MQNESNVMDTVAVAKRWFGNRAGGMKVNCMEREYDSKWEMIKLMPDPSLSDEILLELKNRGIAHPYRWVTVDVVEPFVVIGINKSLTKNEENVNE
jgi:hypothetical protein